MASVAFGSSMAAVAPASSSSAAGRRLRRAQLAVAPAATRGTQAAAPKKEKGILDFIVGAIFKEDQLLVETDPLLNKVDGPAPSSSAGGTASRKAGGTTFGTTKKGGTTFGTSKKGGTTSGGKKPADGGEGGGGGFNLGGLFAKKG